MTAITDAQFESLLEECRRSTNARPGDPSRVVAAARLITEGITVSCGLPVAVEAGPDNPRPAQHYMTGIPSPTERVGIAADYLGLECHGDAQTHIDALCHVSFDGLLYGDVPSSEALSIAGATAGGIEVIAEGLVGRGVLLDVAASLGVEWLEPGTVVTREDLERAATYGRIEPAPGDVVLIRTGHARRRRVLGAWEAAEHKAGLDPRAMLLFRDWGTAALGFDGDGEAVPNPLTRIPSPTHVIGIRGLGLYFIDSMDLERLAECCARLARFQFALVVAPLRLVGGTGCAVNPIALF